MFQKRRGPIVAAILLLSISAQPMISYAVEPSPPAVTAEAADTVQPKQAEGVSLDALRRSSKAKLADTQLWVKDNTQVQDIKNAIKTAGYKIDRLQDRVKPLGRSLKSSVKKHAPGQGLVQMGDRKFSVYGILLMLAFGLVILLMSLSSPASRLGGRH